MGNSLFMNAIMELIQFGSYVSWKLPKKAHLILTSNPTESGANNMSEFDSMQLTRMLTFNVDFDPEVYAKWMDKMNIRKEFIDFVLLNREIFSRSETINARSFTMFANALNSVPSLSDNLSLMTSIAEGAFGDEVVTGLLIQFINNKLDQLIEAKSMLKGEWKDVKATLKQNVYRNGEYSAAIASVITFRFVNYVETYFKTEQDTKKSEKVINRIIDICTDGETLLTEDLLYTLINNLLTKFPTRCQKLLMYEPIRKRIV